MAKNQHYLPRFLLKGFASRKKGKNVYVWVYSQNGHVFETNITNICAERFFYGEEGAGSLDDEITEFEQTYAPLLDELRVKPGITKIEDKSIADFIAHLIIRTKHVRDAFREPAEYLLDKTGEFFSDPDNLQEFFAQNPEILRKAIEEKIDEMPVPEPLKIPIRQFALQNMSAFIQQFKHQLAGASHILRSEAKQRSPNMTSHGQQKALSENLVPEKKAHKYKELTWFSCETEDNLLLGDVGCLIETTSEKRFMSIDMKFDPLSSIYLPISSNHVIVGTSQDSQPVVDVGLLNMEAVKLSRGIFIASENKPELNKLLPLIGKNSELISKEKLDEIVDKKLKV